MKSPTELWNTIKLHMKKSWLVAFWAAFLLGLFIHMPIMLSDIPNHDGLDSIHFDQNMITSGRWFLTVACGISSYFTLPWLIGLLGLIYLGIAAVVLTEFFEIEKIWVIILISGLLVSFPALASTFAYVFTLDGYMMALLLAVLAPLLTKKYRFGFIGGGVCLAFSLGIYQSYLPFSILLSIYGVVILLIEKREIRDKIKSALHYLYMGVMGVGLYYIILQLLLKLQGKELASYQGINGVDASSRTGVAVILKQIYSDFMGFTMNGKVLYHNFISAFFFGVILMIFAICVFRIVCREKLWKSPWLYLIVIGVAVILPVGTNVILIISPEVTYHLLMRYQWVVLIMAMVALSAKEVELTSTKASAKLLQWVLLGVTSGLILFYAVTDNIAYSNLEKKYEKTYAFCVRLADRMEQTSGYTVGMPVAMIGVIGDEQYPLTDITGEVTNSLTGISGDYLLYTRTNYQAFLKNYLGVSIELVSDEEMTDIYYSQEYKEMESFPAADSMKVVEGILYIKLENQEQNGE